LGELVEALAERRMDVLCVQETRWRSDCRFFGAIGKRYKLFLMGNEAKTDGAGIFLAEKWADSVVRVERHSERILVLKMVLGDRLLYVSSVYAPHTGKPCRAVIESDDGRITHLLAAALQTWTSAQSSTTRVQSMLITVSMFLLAVSPATAGKAMSSRMARVLVCVTTFCTHVCISLPWHFFGIIWIKLKLM